MKIEQESRESREGTQEKNGVRILTGVLGVEGGYEKGRNTEDQSNREKPEKY